MPIEHHRKLIEELEAHGIRDAHLVQGNKHPHLEFTLAGRRRKYYTSLSPSDRRATQKAISDLRRIIRQG